MLQKAGMATIPGTVLEKFAIGLAWRDSMLAPKRVGNGIADTKQGEEGILKKPMAALRGASNEKWKRCEEIDILPIKSISTTWKHLPAVAHSTFTYYRV